MKTKFFISLSAIAAIAVMLPACSERSDIPVTQDDKTVRSASIIRSVDAAASLANQIFASDDPESRSAIVKADRNSVHVITSVSSRNGASDTLLYAVDNADGGFALIAAPYSVEPVLAIIDEGSYTDPENLTNEPYQQALAQTISYVETANPKIPVIPDPPGPVKPVFIDAFYLDTIDIYDVQEPLVKVSWGQKWPEGQFAPNKIAGCVPVAMAQLLSAFEKPESMQYTYPNHDIMSETLDWNVIKKHRRSAGTSEDYQYCIDCSASLDNHLTISRLIREIGHRANANYDDNGTGVNDGAVGPIIKQLIELDPIKDSSLSSLYNNMRKNPGVAIIGMGRLKPDGTQSAHMWIADAIKKIEYTIVTYMYDSFVKDYTPSYDTRIDIKLIHLNWGWNGNCNGWFNISTFIKPGEAEEYDYPGSYNGSSFNYDRGFISWFYKLK